MKSSFSIPSIILHPRHDTIFNFKHAASCYYRLSTSFVMHWSFSTTVYRLSTLMCYFYSTNWMILNFTPCSITCTRWLSPCPLNTQTNPYTADFIFANIDDNIKTNFYRSNSQTLFKLFYIFWRILALLCKSIYMPR